MLGWERRAAVRASRRNRSRSSGRAASVGREELDGDRAVERDVAGQVDDAHPAASQLPIERVASGDGVLQFEEERVDQRAVIRSGLSVIDLPEPGTWISAGGRIRRGARADRSAPRHPQPSGLPPAPATSACAPHPLGGAQRLISRRIQPPRRGVRLRQQFHDEVEGQGQVRFDLDHRAGPSG